MKFFRVRVMFLLPLFFVWVLSGCQTRQNNETSQVAATNANYEAIKAPLERYLCLLDKTPKASDVFGGSVPGNLPCATPGAVQKMMASPVKFIPFAHGNAGDQVDNHSPSQIYIFAYPRDRTDNWHLVTPAAKYVDVFSVMIGYQNSFKFVVMTIGNVSHFIYAEIPGDRWADVPVLSINNSTNQQSVTSLRELTFNMLQSSNLKEVEIYRSAPMRELDAYKSANPAQYFATGFVSAFPVSHFGANLIYVEAGEMAVVDLNRKALILARVPKAVFLDWLAKHMLQIHLLRNSFIYKKTTGGIYVEPRAPMLLNGLPMELLMHPNTAKGLVQFSESAVGGYRGELCKFPGLVTKCSDVRAVQGPN